MSTKLFSKFFPKDDSLMLSCTLFQGKSMATFLMQFCGFIKVRTFWRIMFDKMSGTCTRVKTMSLHCSAKYMCRSCRHFQSGLRKCLTISIGYRWRMIQLISEKLRRVSLEIHLAFIIFSKRILWAKTIPNKSKPGRQIANGWPSAKVR
jgi:hypothetical protein